MVSVVFTRNTYSCWRSLKIIFLQVESENADLKLQVVLVTQERDSVIQTNQGLQTKLENLEQVLKVSKIHMAGRTVQTPTAAFEWQWLVAFFDRSFVSVLPVGILLLQDPGQRCFGKAASGIWVGDKVAITDLRLFCDSVALPCDGNFFVQ